MPVWQSIFNLAPAPWSVAASMGWFGAPGGHRAGYMTEHWMIGVFMDFCRGLWRRLPLIAHCFYCFFLYSRMFSVCQDFANEKLQNSVVHHERQDTSIIHPQNFWSIDLLMTLWGGPNDSMLEAHQEEALRFNSSARQLQVEARDEQAKWANGLI